MPEVVTHRYDPAIGPCRNICALADREAEQVLDRLRRLRPTLKPDYLVRRRATEQWLSQAASRPMERPSYFFLGDFSHGEDPSRPAALVIPLSNLPQHAMTFTLGDSMSVVERRVYKLGEIGAHLRDGFGFSDQCGFQRRFIEMKLWRRDS
jgi:hypothetical protein